MDTEAVLSTYFKKHNAGMYLISRQIETRRFPAYGEYVKVKSWVTGCDPLYGYRNTAIYDSNDELCIGSFALGAFIDLAKAMPHRMSPELLASIQLYPPLAMEQFPRKIPIPPGLIPQNDAIRVQSYHLDNYGHMNNARYVDIASAYIPEDFTLRFIRAEYKKAALPGDLIIPHVCRKDDSTMVITLNGENTSLYTVLELRGVSRETP
jgi:acyl-ACP thioesterase